MIDLTSMLDIRTLLFSAACTYLACAAALAMVRWHSPELPGLGRFLLGQVAQFVAFFVYSLTGPVPFWLPNVLGNLLSVTSAALLFDGVRLFYGARKPTWLPWLVPSATLPFFVYFTLIEPVTAPRVLITIGCVGTLSAWIARVAFRASRHRLVLLSLPLVLGHLLLSATIFVRFALILLSAGEETLLTGGAPTALTFIAAEIAMISGTLGLVMVAHRLSVERLQRARDDAEAGTRAKEEFLAVMSHEIRTPMNGVLGSTTLLLDSDLDPRQRRYAEAIRTSGKAMLTILDDVLDFSKAEAGQLTISMAPFDVVATVREAVDSFCEAATVAGLDLRFEVGTRPSRLLLGDPLRLRQVLANLISNAIKFSGRPKGSSELAGPRAAIVVRCTVLESAGDVPEALEGDFVSETIRFEVDDEGPGVPEHKVGQLFDPFTQGDSSTTRSFGGTGLGLAICRRLVDGMGGTIDVDVKEMGSLFWFEVPFVRTGVDAGTSDENSAGAGDRARNEAGASEGTEPSRAGEADEPRSGVDAAPRRERILVVEDDPISRLVASDLVANLGFRVDAVENGRLAVDAVAGARYDLVLMDCRMPVLDGFDATLEIRRLYAKDDLPIVALTATMRPEDLRRCREVGMNEVLAKPLDIEQLRAEIVRWLPGAPSAG